MRTLAGPDASLAFTHLSPAASASLSAALATPDPFPAPAPPASAQAECHEQGVLSLMRARNIPLERVCLLDPKAPTALSPADGDGDGDGDADSNSNSSRKSNFAWFLFGVASPLSPLGSLTPVAYYPYLHSPYLPPPLPSFRSLGLLLLLSFDRSGHPRYVVRLRLRKYNLWAVRVWCGRLVC